ncbi:MAG: hypothetical protein K5663_09080 [Clostridiales bacterium]|nr:hypothetical protein [Clostridiales bacterium]
MSREPVEIKRTGKYYLKRALENEKTGRLFDALKLYHRAFITEDATADMYLRASQNASRLGFTSLAGRYITEAMLRGGAEADCMCAIGFSLCAQGRKQAAQRILDLLPLTRSGPALFNTFADFYYRNFSRPSLPRRRSRGGIRPQLRQLLSELARPEVTFPRLRQILADLDDQHEPLTVYYALRETASQKQCGMLFHALSVSALRAGINLEKALEGWTRLLEIDPNNLFAAEMISYIRQGGEAGPLSLLETRLPAECEKLIYDRLKCLISGVSGGNRVLEPSEKLFLLSVAHSGLYGLFRPLIDQCLAESADEQLKKIKHILPFRADLQPAGSCALPDTANPYAMKYMFLRYTVLPGLNEYGLDRLAWQRSFSEGVCDYLRDKVGGLVEAEMANVIKVFMDNRQLRELCMAHTDTAQAAIVIMYCEAMQPNIKHKTIVKDFEASERSVQRALSAAKALAE